MELRSSRSRSRTPFTSIESFNKEVIEGGSNIEKIVSRTTRRTTYKINESATSSTDEVTSVNVKPARRSLRSEKSVRKVFKTSDYSSEDGENEVSSTKTISQNDKNQLIEDARAAANGSSEVSALNLYKKSGRYWDLYPKTDWTYSHHSKDRVELAPGVVAMPNMSRKTIHSVHGYSDDSSTNYVHKETNTESYLNKSNSFSTNAEYIGSYKPRNLFNNNRYDEYEKITYRVTRWSRLRRSVVSVFTAIYTVFSYIFYLQTPWFAKLHQFASKIMLLDTWLLWKIHTGNKAGRLAALCLVPLFLLGGWWLLSSLGAALFGAYSNSTLGASPVAQTLVQEEDVTFELQNSQVSESDFEESPKVGVLAAGLSSEQINAITKSLKDSLKIENELNTDKLVEKIIANPSFQTIVNNYNNIQTYEKMSDDNIDRINNQQKIIEDLTDQMNKIRLDMAEAEKRRLQEINNILTEFKVASAQQNAYLTYQLNRCCRKPLLNIEGYISKIITNLLNDVDFLKSQKGLEDYFQTIFMAKQDLESQLVNLTSNLNLKYETLVEDNSRVLMDEVTRKINLELNLKVENMKANSVSSPHSNDIHVGKISDQNVKQIVKEALAIYDADKTGLVDYAMETMGGQVLTTRCTENYHYGKAVVSVLGIPLWYPVNSPRTVITPSINPGECWAFQNFPGFVVLRLSNRVKIEAFSLEHISKLLVPHGKIDSAPKEFEVYGLAEENDKEPVKLGEYVYDAEGDPLQFFAVENVEQAYGIVELRIVSNHGNPSYTCLYRFRVHGKLSES